MASEDGTAYEWFFKKVESSNPIYDWQQNDVLFENPFSLPNVDRGPP